MTPSTAKDAGAPVIYSRALGLDICDRTAAGASPRSLRGAPFHVRQSELRGWLDGNPEFAALFGLACAAGVAPQRYGLTRAAEFCRRVADGAMVSEACDQEGMPSLATLQWWTHRRPEFAAMLAAALDAQSRRLADQVTAIADAASPETLQISRMRIAARQWLAARLARQTPDVPGRPPAVAETEGWPAGLVVEAAEF